MRDIIPRRTSVYEEWDADFVDYYADFSGHHQYRSPAKISGTISEIRVPFLRLRRGRVVAAKDRDVGLPRPRPRTLQPGWIKCRPEWPLRPRQDWHFDCLRRPAKVLYCFVNSCTNTSLGSGRSAPPPLLYMWSGRPHRAQMGGPRDRAGSIYYGSWSTTGVRAIISRRVVALAVGNNCWIQVD